MSIASIYFHRQFADADFRAEAENRMRTPKVSHKSEEVHYCSGDWFSPLSGGKSPGASIGRRLGGSRSKSIDDRLILCRAWNSIASGTIIKKEIARKSCAMRESRYFNPTWREPTEENFDLRSEKGARKFLVPRVATKKSVLAETYIDRFPIPRVSHSRTRETGASLLRGRSAPSSCAVSRRRFRRYIFFYVRRNGLDNYLEIQPKW